jgi:hypothetical protein
MTPPAPLDREVEDAISLVCAACFDASRTIAVVPAWDVLRAAVAASIARERREEREANAKICDEIAAEPGLLNEAGALTPWFLSAHECAIAIRTRAKE